MLAVKLFSVYELPHLDSCRVLMPQYAMKIAPTTRPIPDAHKKIPM
jgi:hypothetical protein